ncbi:hypothetical protein NOX19_004514 [Klebsiella aerogenes]|uniref:hypothetical protein n=1 Tax=Klebsiella aerogenes TaxID=548 RepID=UPI000A9B8E73|nr:hypothetical protein [Klebsiella aerogenes]EKU6611384.1 hypothetical protein [Klebsiella aerogenes]EKW5858314.1 hypothetical protein [Klebsiella aerogenes]
MADLFIRSGKLFFHMEKNEVKRIINNGRPLMMMVINYPFASCHRFFEFQQTGWQV